MRWLIVAALLAGCPRKTMTDDERKKDYVEGMKPVLAQHQAAVTATLDALAAIPKLAAADPPVTTAEALPAPVECKRDTCLIKTVEPVGRIALEDTPNVDWDKVPRILRGEHDEYVTWQSDAYTLELIVAITHVAVVRVREYEKPVVGEKSDRYSGGRAAGDVIVYDVKGKKRVGAFPWAVSVPETAQIDANSADPGASIENVFVGHAASEIRSALTAFYAGKAPPVEPPKDDGRLRERQISDLLARQKMPVNEVEITDGPECKVVLVTAMPGLLAAHPSENPLETDGVLKPEAIETVRTVMEKDCAVSSRLP
jgi:hypothetical protein